MQQPSVPCEFAPSAPYPYHQSSMQQPAQLPYPISPPSQNEHVYPALGEYMGLELSPEVIAANLPEYVNPPTNVSLIMSQN